MRAFVVAAVLFVGAAVTWMAFNEPDPQPEPRLPTFAEAAAALPSQPVSGTADTTAPAMPRDDQVAILEQAVREAVASSENQAAVLQVMESVGTDLFLACMAEYHDDEDFCRGWVNGLFGLPDDPDAIYRALGGAEAGLFNHCMEKNNNNAEQCERELAIFNAPAQATVEATPQRAPTIGGSDNDASGVRVIRPQR